VELSSQWPRSGHSLSFLRSSTSRLMIAERLYSSCQLTARLLDRLWHIPNVASHLDSAGQQCRPSLQHTPCTNNTAYIRYITTTIQCCTPTYQLTNKYFDLFCGTNCCTLNRWDQSVPSLQAMVWPTSIFISAYSHPLSNQPQATMEFAAAYCKAWNTLLERYIFFLMMTPNDIRPSLCVM